MHYKAFNVVVHYPGIFNKFGSVSSLSLTTASGIQQGGVCLPTHMMFTHDLIAALRNIGTSCHIHDKYIHSLSYAVGTLRGYCSGFHQCM